MSLTVFVQCFKQGEPAGLPTSAVRALFPVIDAESEPNQWLVRYDALNWCTMYVSVLATDPTLVKSLCVSRPCGDVRLWNALLAMLRMGSVVLFVPSDPPTLIAVSDLVAKDLPHEFVEAMGQPRVVASGQEIVEIIRQA